MFDSNMNYRKMMLGYPDQSTLQPKGSLLEEEVILALLLNREAYEPQEKLAVLA
jgi:hypothetical protein